MINKAALELLAPLLGGFVLIESRFIFRQNYFCNLCVPVKVLNVYFVYKCCGVTHSCFFPMKWWELWLCVWDPAHLAQHNKKNCL